MLFFTIGPSTNCNLDHVGFRFRVKVGVRARVKVRFGDNHSLGYESAPPKRTASAARLRVRVKVRVRVSVRG